jgi:hypothetical protein
VCIGTPTEIVTTEIGLQTSTMVLENSPMPVVPFMKVSVHMCSCLSWIVIKVLFVV